MLDLFGPLDQDPSTWDRTLIPRGAGLIRAVHI
jgi:predicted RNA polymerase sigma factor